MFFKDGNSLPLNISRRWSSSTEYCTLAYLYIVELEFWLRLNINAFLATPLIATFNQPKKCIFVSKPTMLMYSYLHFRNRLVWNAVPTLVDVPNPPPTIGSKRKLPTPRMPPLPNTAKRRRLADEFEDNADGKKNRKSSVCQ